MIGAPVARTAAVAGTAAVAVHGHRRRDDRRDDRRDGTRGREGDRRPRGRHPLSWRARDVGLAVLIPRDTGKIQSPVSRTREGKMLQS